MQMCLMQETAFKMHDKAETTPSALAQLMRAFSELEERKRILRMKPKPKDIDVDPRNHRPARGSVSAQLMDSPDGGQPAPRPAPRKPTTPETIDTTAEPLQTPGLDREPEPPLQ